MKLLIMIGIGLIVCWAILWLGIKLTAVAVHLVLLAGLGFIIWGVAAKARDSIASRR